MLAMFGCRDGSDLETPVSSAASALTGPISRYIYAGTATTLRVYDMDDGHRLVKTINLPHATGQMTGIVANVALHTLFMNFKTATGRVVAMDLHTDQELWWRDVTPGADRGDVSIDGTKLYVPGGEYNSVPDELVLDGRNGNEIKRFTLTPKVHDTDVGISGQYAYMETKSSNIVTMVDIATNTIFKQLNFTDIVGPHAVNGTDTYVIGNVNQWFGFEMVSVATGNVVARVHAEGVADPPAQNPPALENHAIAWKPDETEVFLGSKFDPNLFIFDMTVMPPVQKRRITVGAGYTNIHWITVSIDGNYVYPSGDQNAGIPVQIYDSRTWQVIGTMGYSEKLTEVDFQEGQVVAVGNQYGIGRVAAPPTAPPPPPTGLTATGGDAQVVLGWNPVVGASSYTVKWGTVPGGPYSSITGITGAGYTHTGRSNGATYYYVVSASNALGESPNSGEVQATPSAPPPVVWANDAIPSTLNPAGSFSQTGSTLTVSASGTDIYGTADQFRFVHQALTGDGSITARVATLCGGTPGSCPNVWTKAGVMMRDGLAAGARNVAAILSPTATNKFRLSVRTTAGGSTSTTASTPNSQVPAYVRVTRAGNNFSTFYSTNGTTFTQMGATQTIAMPATIRIGLAVTSHTPGTLASATFDNVVITTPTPPTPPPAPAGLLCTSGVGQCQLSWNSVTGATSYTVKRSTTAGGPYVVRQSGITVTSYTDTMVSAGTTYFYVVSAVNGSGESPNSSQGACTPTLPPPPLAPANLVATAGNNSVGLTWSASAGATSYTVKRASIPGGPYTPLTPSPTGTSFTDSTAANGTAYFYVVTASNAGGESASSSNEAPATPSLPAPTGVVATAGNAQVGLTWNAVTNATGYLVKRALVTGGPYTPLSPAPTSPSFTDTTVSNDTTYYYVVSATSSEHEGPNSAQVSATPTVSMAPAPPSNLGATITGGNTANLTWSDNSSNETGFRIERKIGAGAYATLTTKAAGVTTHADPNLTANTYTYRVIATGTPNSAPSNEVVVTIGNPVADAYVRSGTSAGTNFGTATVVDVKHTNTTTTRRNGFLRFSLAGVQATVTSAKLRLYGNAVTSAKATNVHSVADITWGETTITWNTPTTDAGGPTMSVSPLSTQTVGLTAAYVEWDVTAYVQARKTAGAAAISLGLKSGVLSDEGQNTFNSREGTNKPILVISSRP
jgi:fibronectin type 3 domain-containing protein